MAVQHLLVFIYILSPLQFNINLEAFHFTQTTNYTIFRRKSQASHPSFPSTTRVNGINNMSSVHPLAPLLINQFLESIGQPALGADEDTSCYICSETYLSGDTPEFPIALACGHKAGSICIMKWLSPLRNTGSNSCPQVSYIFAPEIPPNEPTFCLDKEMLTVTLFSAGRPCFMSGRGGTFLHPQWCPWVTAPRSKQRRLQLRAQHSATSTHCCRQEGARKLRWEELGISP